MGSTRKQSENNEMEPVPPQFEYGMPWEAILEHVINAFVAANRGFRMTAAVRGVLNDYTGAFDLVFVAPSV